MEEISPPLYEHSSDKLLRKWDLRPRCHNSFPQAMEEQVCQMLPTYSGA